VRGGGIGRGDDNAVQLSDLSVSRSHCTIELIDGQLALVDNKSTNKTLVNGEPVKVHLLKAGDEISVGKTRMSFIPGDPQKASKRTVKPSRVTMEIGSGELLQVAREKVLGPDGRAQRHLASLARLGDALRTTGDRSSVAKAACDVAVNALLADRAFVLMRDVGNRLMPAGSTIAASDPDGASYALAPDAVQKVMQEGKAIALEAHEDGGRAAVAAPLSIGAGEAPLGLLLVRLHRAARRRRARRRRGARGARHREPPRRRAARRRLGVHRPLAAGAPDPRLRRQGRAQRRDGPARRRVGQRQGDGRDFAPQALEPQR
jgi:hypothetical protein